MHKQPYCKQNQKGQEGKEDKLSARVDTNHRVLESAAQSPSVSPRVPEDNCMIRAKSHESEYTEHPADFALTLNQILAKLNATFPYGPMLPMARRSRAHPE